jgi:hypothetical protein
MFSPEARVERVSGDELNTTAGSESGLIVFSKDGVHPYLDTGHALYAQALDRSLITIRSQGSPGAHHLDQPIDPGHWQDARMVELTDPRLFTGEATQLDPKKDPVAAKFAHRLPSLWKLSPGTKLHFKFKGTKASLYGLLSPDSGQIEITVDGKRRKVPLFDAYTTYPRLGLFAICDGLEDREHEVTVTVLADPLDKQSILPEEKKKELLADPSKYAGQNSYLGSVLLIGEMSHP